MTDTWSPRSAGRPAVPRQQTGPRPRTIIIPPQDPRWMTRLRATTYVLTSIASLLFIALVVYGAVQLNRLGGMIEDLSTPSVSSTEAPPDPSVPVP